MTTLAQPIATGPSGPLTEFDDYLMLDFFGTAIELRRMSSAEAQAANLELEAVHVPYRWISVAKMQELCGARERAGA